jgi:hypothetical protein
MPEPVETDDAGTETGKNSRSMVLDSEIFSENRSTITL